MTSRSVNGLVLVCTNDYADAIHLTLFRGNTLKTSVKQVEISHIAILIPACAFDICQPVVVDQLLVCVQSSFIGGATCDVSPLHLTRHQPQSPSYTIQSSLFLKYGKQSRHLIHQPVFLCISCFFVIASPLHPPRVTSARCLPSLISQTS